MSLINAPQLSLSHGNALVHLHDDRAYGGPLQEHADRIASFNVHYPHGCPCGTPQDARASCRVVKLVRALRKGWLKPRSEQPPKEDQEASYLMWQDDGMASDKTAIGALMIAPRWTVREP